MSPRLVQALAFDRLIGLGRSSLLELEPDWVEGGCASECRTRR
jgi:hypothetical protein